MHNADMQDDCMYCEATHPSSKELQCFAGMPACKRKPIKSGSHPQQAGHKVGCDGCSVRDNVASRSAWRLRSRQVRGRDIAHVTDQGRPLRRRSLRQPL